MKILLVLTLAVIAAVAIALPFRSEIRAILNPFPDYSQLQEEDVVMYSTSWCKYCKKARSLLEERGVKYTEYDIEKSEVGAAQYRAIRGSGVPVLVIDGQVVRGFDANKIIRLLDEMVAKTAPQAATP